MSEEELGELKALVNRIESRKRQQHSKLLEKKSAKLEDNNSEDDNLTFDEVDNAIIAFVLSKSQEQDGGPNQSQIVAEIRKNYGTLTGIARPTLLKRIGKLVEYKVLIERPDSKNRQTKRYYVSKENLLLQLHRYFDSLEDALINLVKSFIEKNGGPVTGQKVEEVLFFSVIFELYQHVRAITMTHATFNWPKVTNDPVLLNKLYRALFAKVIKLQENLSKALAEANIDTYRNFFISSWMMRPEVIDQGLAVAQKYDLPNEHVSRVFNLAWSIGAPVVEYARMKFEKGTGPHEGVDEMTNVSNAEIEKWKRPEGWKDAYLYWKGQQEIQKEKK